MVKKMLSNTNNRIKIKIELIKRELNVIDYKNY